MRVGVVSPFPLAREGLYGLLSMDKGLQVVAKLESLGSNLDTIRKMNLEVLLIQSPASLLDGRTLFQLRELVPDTKALLLLDEVDEEAEYEALLAGARGFLSRAATPATLIKAVRAVAQGELWVTHRATTRLVDERATRDKVGQVHSELLTHRESEILRQLAEGNSNKGIAEQLCVSENTVKAHVHPIFRKLSVQTRWGATLYYFRYSGRGGSNSAAARSIAATVRNFLTSQVNLGSNGRPE